MEARKRVLRDPEPQRLGSEHGLDCDLEDNMQRLPA